MQDPSGARTNPLTHSCCHVTYLWAHKWLALVAFTLAMVAARIDFLILATLHTRWDLTWQYDR